MPASSADDSPGATPAVDLAGVTVRYGTVAALQAVSLRVEAGERVALVGSSGAGKSTLLRLLAGLVSPSEGTASVLGREADRLAGAELRRHRAQIGLISQDLDLTGPLRVVHNVNAGRLGRWSTAAAVWSLLRPSGRAAVEDALEQLGLGGRADAVTEELSGGERQRVAVARVLVQKPALVVADEPVSAVDPRLSGDVLSRLAAPVAEAPWTVVASLHEPVLAREHFGRVIGLAGGRLVFDEPAASVRAADLTRLYAADPGR